MCGKYSINPKLKIKLEFTKHKIVDRYQMNNITNKPSQYQQINNIMFVKQEQEIKK